MPLLVGVIYLLLYFVRLKRQFFFVKIFFFFKWKVPTHVKISDVSLLFFYLFSLLCSPSLRGGGASFRFTFVCLSVHLGEREDSCWVLKTIDKSKFYSVRQYNMLGTFSVFLGIYEQVKCPVYVLLSWHSSVCPSENFVTKVEKWVNLCPIDTFLVLLVFAKDKAIYNIWYIYPCWVLLCVYRYSCGFHIDTYFSYCSVFFFFFHTERWELERYKYFFTYIHLDLFRSHPLIHYQEIMLYI